MNDPLPIKISSGYTLVETAPALALVTEKLQGTSRVGIDTEADSLHHYAEKVCLIQLSFLGENYVIDPLCGFSLAEFLEVLSRKELIFQGADYDLRILYKSFGFKPQAPVFDTMLAAQVLGYEKIGLAALVERFFGIVMSKSGQKADWSKRPLTEKLLTYASDDTKYLEAIADLLSVELQKLDRMLWHKECCERVARIMEQGDRKDKKESWRVKGSTRLPPEVLVYVKELWQWRDDEAREKDRPPFRILRNEDLVELAAWRSQNRGVPLQQGPSFLSRMYERKILGLEKACQTAENLPPEEWPQPEKRRSWREESYDQDKLDQMLAAGKSLAAELQIESSFLASRAALTSVIRHKPGSVDEVMEVSNLMRWQATLLMPAIQVILSGDLSKP